MDEESTEEYYQICNVLDRKYKNQRGILKVKYSMNKLTLLTSPKYCQKYK